MTAASRFSLNNPDLSPRRVGQIAVPIVAGVLATNLMTVIDALMVGQLGDAALGGVGIGGQLFFLWLAAALGLGAAVQAMVARRVGEKRLESVGLLLNGGIALAFTASGVLIIAGYSTLPSLFLLINSDAELVQAGTAYLDWRLPSLLILAINVVFRSYWVGINRALVPMIAIMVLSVANVLFNYVFIFGKFGAPEMGVAGAGFGSTLATAAGLIVYVTYGFREAVRYGFLRGLPDHAALQTLIKLAIPDSLRQVLFSVGVVGMYLLIGLMGTPELAAFHVVISICLVAYMPHNGLAGAATTLVSEYLGRNDAKTAADWGWMTSVLNLVLLGLIGAVIAWFAKPILGLFLVDSETLTIAIVPLQLAVFAHVLDGYARVLGAAFIGAGATATAMKLAIIPQWVLLIPGLLMAVFLDWTLTQAMWVFLSHTAIAALISAYFWRRGDWHSIKV